ncbi:MAG: hypothetical protein HYU77_08035 [Betaproteobacteria bacterium]|nr:hypothetical protein [Betaproteobacteria bacterium]
MPLQSAVLEDGDIQCQAYNMAFQRLGLKWHWDAGTFAELAQTADEKERIRVYIRTCQAHLLKVYDANALSDLIYSEKCRCQEDLCRCHGTGAAPQWAWDEECLAA